MGFKSDEEAEADFQRRKKIGDLSVYELDSGVSDYMTARNKNKKPVVQKPKVKTRPVKQDRNQGLYDMLDKQKQYNKDRRKKMNDTGLFNLKG